MRITRNNLIINSIETRSSSRLHNRRIDTIRKASLTTNDTHPSLVPNRFECLTNPLLGMIHSYLFLADSFQFLRTSSPRRLKEYLNDKAVIDLFKNRIQLNSLEAVKSFIKFLESNSILLTEIYLDFDKFKKKNKDRAADLMIEHLVDNHQKIESLHLKGFPIKDHHLERFSVFQRLNSMHLGDCQGLTPKGWEAFHALASLEMLTVRNCFHITDEDFAILVGALPHLHSFSIGGTSYEFEGSHLNKLKHLPLKELEISLFPEIKDEYLDFLMDLPYLEKLILRHLYKFRGNRLQSLKSPNLLKHLNLTYCSCLNNRGLQWIANCVFLETFILRDCIILSDDALEHLKHLPSLNLVYLAIENFENIDNLPATKFLRLVKKGTNLTNNRLKKFLTEHSIELINRSSKVIQPFLEEISRDC